MRRLGGIARVERRASAVVKGFECARSLLGVCRDDMAPPFESFRPPERARVRAILEELGLLEPQPGAMPSRP